MRIFVVYASADGSTAEIARRIAQRLRERGHDASDQPGSPRDWQCARLAKPVRTQQRLDVALPGKTNWRLPDVQAPRIR